MSVRFQNFKKGLREGWAAHKPATVFCIITGFTMFCYLVLQIYFNPEFPGAFTAPPYRRAMWLFGLTLIVLFFFAFFSVCYFRIRLHRLAIVLIPVLGVVYMMLIPINAVPDEWRHIPTAYRISNYLLGVSSAEEDATHILARKDDAEVFSEPWTHDVPLPNQRLDRQEYIRYWNYFGTPLNDGSLVLTENEEILNLSHFHPHQFTGPVIGLVIGRLLRLGAYDLLLFARICSLLFATVMTVFAIRLLPVKKALLLVIAILPVTVQQAMSFSYDSFTNAVAFLLFALSVYLMYTPPADKRKRHLAVVLLFALAIALAFCKQYSYCPFLLLPVYTIYRLGYLKKKHFLGLFAIAALFVVLTGVRIISSYWSFLAAETVPHFININAMRLRVLFATMMDHFGEHLLYMISNLGSLDLYAQYVSTATLVFLLLMVIASFRKKDEPVMINIPDRVVYLAIFSVSVLGFAVAHWLLHKEGLAESFIDQIQGRYYTPVMMPFLYAVSTKFIEADERVDTLIVPGAVCMHFFVVISVLAHAPA